MLSPTKQGYIAEGVAEKYAIMSIVIKVASASDASTIVRLNQDVQGVHAVLEPTFFKADPDKKEVTKFFIEKVLAPDNHFSIAAIDGKVAGYIWFEVQNRPEAALTFPRKRIYVHHLSVSENSRCHGVASALLHYVEDQATALGIKDIALDAWAANGSALRFFSARGFVPFNISLRRRQP